MSSLFEHIQNHPQDAQRLLGLKYEQLEKLLEKARELHYKKLASSEAKKVRIIAAGGGRKTLLSLEEQVLLTLTYLRHLTTFQLLGFNLESAKQPPMIPSIIGVLFWQSYYRLAYLNK